MNEITLYEKIQDPIAACLAIGPHFARTLGCTKIEQGAVIALTCFCERISPIEFQRMYHITDDGKISKKALRQAAEFLARGGKEKWLHTGKDGQKAECEFTFNGQTIVETFTIDDARRQGLPVDNPKSGWKKTPANMLRARVRTNALGILCPDIVAGDAGEEDATDRPGLNLAPQPAAPVATPKTEPAIDVQSEVVQPTATTEPTAPTQPTEQPTAAQTLFRAEQGDNGRLTVPTVQALMEAIGEQNGEAALKWLEKRGWLKPLQDLGNLSVRHAQAILDKPDGFLKQVNGGQ